MNELESKYVSKYKKALIDKLTVLRQDKNLSENQMSRQLGLCKGYIQQISSGRMLPSLSNFFAICEFFEITPMEFFDMDNHYPYEIQQLLNVSKQLSEKDLALALAVIQRISDASQADIEKSVLTQ